MRSRLLLLTNLIIAITISISLFGSCANAVSTHYAFVRLLNASSGEHFYTTDQTETNYAVAHYGYVSEGSVGFIDITSSAGNVPLYRLHANYAGHFYTTSQDEANYAIAHYAYSSEGIAGYISPTSGSGLVPLYRLLNVGTSQHFYTLSSDEANYAVAHYGYVSEGIVGYVYTS